MRIKAFGLDQPYTDLLRKIKAAVNGDQVFSFHPLIFGGKIKFVKQENIPSRSTKKKKAEKIFLNDQIHKFSSEPELKFLKFLVNLS
jgi:hypothetical protein